ncbi:MAG: branched-chain amino acid ABC transporter permease [Pseudomonadota bacterium]
MMKKKDLGLILGAIVALLVIPRGLPNYFITLLTLSLIFSIVALSLDVLIGYTGLGAIGHAAYFAIGAYTAGILITRYQASFWTTLWASIAMAGVLSALFGILVLRTKGVFFFIISLAVAMVIWGIAYRWGGLTGGDAGITGIARPELGFHWDLVVPINFYYLILLFWGISLTLLALVIKSPFGKTMVGIRDAPGRMQVLGYNVWLHQYIALIICGAFAGLAGNLYIYYNSFIGPTSTDVASCMEFLLMVIIGGPGTLVGACLGAFIIVFLKEIVSMYTARWLIFLGSAYIITAIFAPKGIVGLWRGYFEKNTVSTEKE